MTPLDFPWLRWYATELKRPSAVLFAGPKAGSAGRFGTTHQEGHMAKDFLFSSESVTEGHPDKVADQISDAILDSILAEDPDGRVACETLVTTGLAMIAGEITTSCYVDFPEVARETIKSIGYTDALLGYDYKTCSVVSTIDKQSPDISQGVTEGKGKFKDQGAGDQGLMFGYACRDTAELMPLPIALSHDLTRRLAKVRKEGVLDFLGPDGKAQVSVEFENEKPKRVHTVVVSTQHRPEAKYKAVHDGVLEEVIKKAIPAKLMDKNTRVFVNPTGRFVIGGPQGDCGLTGRKIIVDTYGGWARHGGGAFSGKDPSKVDRSASYMARYIAKNLVAAHIAEKCEIQLAYAIGVAEPVSVMATTFGTGKIEENRIVELIRRHFDLRPRGIIESLNLLRPIYRSTAAYGHFGTNARRKPWEQTDKAAILKEDAGL